MIVEEAADLEWDDKRYSLKHFLKDKALLPDESDSDVTENGDSDTQ